MEAATVPPQGAAPAPPPAQPPQQQQSQHDLLAAIVVVLLSGMTLEAMASALAPLLGPLGVAPFALKTALGITLLRPSEGVTIPTGPASLMVWATEPARRAAYLLAASQRLEQNPDIQAERLNYGRHLDAVRARHAAATGVDVAARSFGVELGWYSIRDHLTTPECRAAHGSNFHATVPPAIGYPGTPHGGTCRCRAGAPFPNAGTVDEVTADVLHEGHDH